MIEIIRKRKYFNLTKIIEKKPFITLLDDDFDSKSYNFLRNVDRIADIIEDVASSQILHHENFT